MQNKTNSHGFFSSQTKANIIESHIIIPTSVEHHYENNAGDKAYRNALYLKKYESNDSVQNPIIFFHGGPDIVNQEQFSEMQQYFTQKGHPFYIPEIEGSAMYTFMDIPTGFAPEHIPAQLNLFGLNQFGGDSGLNEFTKNYADDIKDVLEEVAKRHPGKKINVITHSLGGHHFLATLQHYPQLANQIDAICNVAGTVDVGANRFISTLKQCVGSRSRFELMLANQSANLAKSEANVNQPGPIIDKKINPSANREMNQKISVLHNDTRCFPPIFLVHAANDQAVFFQGSILLEQKIKQQGGTVQGLYFPTGGHLFIKNEGDPEIRFRALEKMKDFFQQPYKKMECDISQLVYEDIQTLHQQFLDDNEAFLDSHYQSTGLKP